MKVPETILLATLASVDAHYVWLSPPTTDANEAIVTFAETPVSKSAAAFVKHLLPLTAVHSASSPATSSQLLNLTMRSLDSGDAELVGSIPNATDRPRMLEGVAVWGLFSEKDPDDPPLLKYWFSAPTVPRANDWAYVDGASTNRLSLSLRPAACESQEAADVPTVAIARFDGRSLPNANITIIDATGARTSTLTTGKDGTAAVRLPPGAPTFAIVSHVERAIGVDPSSGKPYKRIAHYATHSATVMAPPPESQLPELHRPVW